MDINGLSSMYGDLYKTADPSSTKLENSLGGGLKGATDDELMDACKAFESYFVEQMYKEMLKTIPTNDDDSTANKTMLDFYKDQMVQKISSETSEQGSLGLAQMLYEQMKRNIGTTTIPTES